MYTTTILTSAHVLIPVSQYRIGVDGRFEWVIAGVPHDEADGDLQKYTWFRGDLKLHYYSRIKRSHPMLLQSFDRRSDNILLIFSFFISPLNNSFLKCWRRNVTSISKISKSLTSIWSNLNIFHPLEVVDRVSETKLQVVENFNEIIWRLMFYSMSV